jgi:hypothetical protein
VKKWKNNITVCLRRRGCGEGRWERIRIMSNEGIYYYLNEYEVYTLRNQVHALQRFLIILREHERGKLLFYAAIFPHSF